MTAPAQKNENARFVIDLESTADKEMANVMFNTRPGLANQFEKAFGIQFLEHHAASVVFTGDPDIVHKVQKAFTQLSGAFEAGSYVSKDLIKKTAQQLNVSALRDKFDAANQNGGVGFTPKTPAQAEQARLIDENDLVFAIGSAGTGKTHVAMVKAVQALKSGRVKKILLARPAVEAGEKIGFLPGDQNAKLAPYMRPLYDELDKLYGPGKYQKMLSDGIIEVVPLSFMRGRTFENAFIVIDEAQNMTEEHFHMALTRVGPGSKCVVTGDDSQIDLPNKEDSGLVFAAEIMKDKPGIGVMRYEASDVIRSYIAQTVVEAFAEAAAKKSPAPATPTAAAGKAKPKAALLTPHKPGQ